MLVPRKFPPENFPLYGTCAYKKHLQLLTYLRYENMNILALHFTVHFDNSLTYMYMYKGSS